MAWNYQNADCGLRMSVSVSQKFFNMARTTTNATCVWSPHYNYAIDKVEVVQRKFTKRLNGCKDRPMEYPARLSYLHLQSLERRRLTSDLILTYRIIFGLVDIFMSDYFRQMSADGDCTVTRGNPFKLSVNYCRTNTRKNFLANVLQKFGQFTSKYCEFFFLGNI